MERLHGYALPFRAVEEQFEDCAQHSLVDAYGATIAVMDGEENAAGKLTDFLAAAPELFSALKTLVDCFDICKTPAQFVAQIDKNGFMNDARAALQRAGVA